MNPKEKQIKIFKAFREVEKCWKCEHLNSIRIDDGWRCLKKSEMFGNPKINTKEQCLDFSSESGTDAAEFLNK